MSTSELMSWGRNWRGSRKTAPRTTKMTWERAETEAPGLLGPSRLTPYDLKVLEKIEREKAERQDR